MVRNNVVENTTGDGIVVRRASAPLCEYNTAVHCCAKVGTANVAIWTFGCDDAVIQYCEAYDTVPGGSDKQGFDIDHSSNRAVLQYNYSHNNSGGFVLVCTPAGSFNDGSIVRYNISQNDRDDIIRPQGR